MIRGKRNKLGPSAAEIDTVISRAARGDYDAIKHFETIGPTAVPALVRAWRGPTPEGIHGRDYLEDITAAISFASRDDAGPLIALIQAGKEPVDPLLWLATGALGDSRDPRARDVMLTLLEHPAPLIRQQAAEAVIAWKDQRAIVPLLRLLRRARPRELVTYCILEGLQRNPEMLVPEFAPLLERIIERPSTLPGSRRVACDLLDTLRFSIGVPTEFERLDWTGQMIDDGMLARGSQSPRLQTLVLDETEGLDDGALRTIGGWTTLEELRLRWQWDRVTIDLSFLKGLTNLRRLELQNIIVVPGSERALAKLKRLESLTCLSVDRSDPVLRYVKGYSQLERLQADPMSEDALRRMGPLTKLRHLSVDGVWPGRPPIDAIRELKALEFLSLGHDWATDDALAALGTLSNLRFLGLNGARLSNAGLASLERLPHLAYLDLDRSRIGDEGIKILAGMPQLTGLSLRHCELSDASVKSLRRLKKLRHLIIYRQLSPTARRELSTSRPGLTINRHQILSHAFSDDERTAGAS